MSSASDSNDNCNGSSVNANANAYGNVSVNDDNGNCNVNNNYAKFRIIVVIRKKHLSEINYFKIKILSIILTVKTYRNYSNLYVFFRIMYNTFQPNYYRL